MDTANIALQLYTVRDQTANDFVGTLAKVAQMGYVAVEFAGYGNIPPAQLRETMHRLGLKTASTHINWDRLQNNFENELHYCEVLGSQYLVLASLPQPMRTAEALPEVVEQIQRTAKRCADQGLRFGYHNHDPEFALIDGVPWLDRLMDATADANVALELDLYWAAYAGADPQRAIQHYAHRLRLLHVKDLAADRTYTEVGSGTLDWPTLLPAAQHAGCEWFIVEHDKPTLPSLESANQSLTYLRGLTLA